MVKWHNKVCNNVINVLFYINEGGKKAIVYSFLTCWGTSTVFTTMDDPTFSRQISPCCTVLLQAISNHMWPWHLYSLTHTIDALGSCKSWLIDRKDTRWPVCVLVTSSTAPWNIHAIVPSATNVKLSLHDAKLMNNCNKFIWNIAL